MWTFNSFGVNCSGASLKKTGVLVLLNTLDSTRFYVGSYARDARLRPSKAVQFLSTMVALPPGGSRVMVGEAVEREARGQWAQAHQNRYAIFALTFALILFFCSIFYFSSFFCLHPPSTKAGRQRCSSERLG